MAIRQVYDMNNYLKLDKKEQEFTFFYAKSGYGKTLAVESLIEEYFNLGYTVLILNDVKDTFEMANAMFSPTEKYHLDHLNKIGKEVQTKNVKIFHPFTFRIPKNKPLPEIEFYGFSLKDIGRFSWSMLSESRNESETVRLLMNASETLSSSGGLYEFLHNVEENVIGKKEKNRLKADPKLFNLKVTSSSAKGLKQVASFLLPFKRDYFLVPNNSNIKLDWKEILNDNKSYHLFSTKWIKDPKIKNFVILTLLEEIVDNIDNAHKPLLIVINEIRFLTPEYPMEGYQDFIIYAIMKRFSVLRNMGDYGVSGIFDSQVWKDTNSNVKSCSTRNFYGELGSADDLEKLSKANKYKRDVTDQLRKMDARNNYLMHGSEDEGQFTFWFPGHAHAEENTTFFQQYKLYFPDKLRNYSKLYDMMQKEIKEEDRKSRQKVLKQEKEEEIEKEKSMKEKESSKAKTEDLDEVKKENIELKAQSKMEKMKRCWEVKQDNPQLSNRQIADKVGLHHVTVKKYIDDYEKILAKEKGEDDKTDFEDKVLMETNETPDVPLLGEDFELPEE